MAVNFDLGPWEVVVKGPNKLYPFDEIFKVLQITFFQIGTEDFPKPIE